MKEIIKKLKRENYRKQMLVTRLLVQRNNERFFITKIKMALFKAFNKIGAQTGNNFNVFDAINILIERASLSWNKYEKLLIREKELIRTNNALREEIESLHQNN